MLKYPDCEQYHISIPWLWTISCWNIDIHIGPIFISDDHIRKVVYFENHTNMFILLWFFTISIPDCDHNIKLSVHKKVCWFQTYHYWVRCMGASVPILEDESIQPTPRPNLIQPTHHPNSIQPTYHPNWIRPTHHTFSSTHHMFSSTHHPFSSTHHHISNQHIWNTRHLLSFQHHFIILFNIFIYSHSNIIFIIFFNIFI